MHRKGKVSVIELLKPLRNLRYIDSTIFRKLFDTQVKPMLNFGAVVWGLKDNEDMDKVYTMVIKRFFYFKYSTT